MQKKYQIFISSTYVDLKEQRDAVMKSCLLVGHIPIGMEMFNPADEEQWSIIRKTIDLCDYYCLIVAHRYGSMVGGVSYTEKEYDYAISIGLPVLRFMLTDDALWPAANYEKDDKARQALGRFKKKIRSKFTASWKNTDELQYKFAAALPQAMTAHPRPGWIRVSDDAYQRALEEVARLSRENSLLTARIADVVKVEEDIAFTLKEKIYRLQFDHKDGDIKYYTVDLAYLYSILGGKLAAGMELKNVEEFLKKWACSGKSDEYWWRNISLLTDMINTLMAFGLIRQSIHVIDGYNATKIESIYYNMSERGSAVYYYVQRNRSREDPVGGIAD